MFCANCGNQLPEGARFCGSCGTPTVIVPVEEKAVEAAENTAAVEEKAVEFDEKAAVADGNAAAYDEKAATFDEKAAEFDEKAAAFEEKAVEAAEVSVAVKEKAVESSEAPVAVEQTQPEAPAMPESNTIICRNCGNRLPERAIFCGNCGTPVVAASAEEKAVEEKAAVAAETSVQIAEQAANAVETPVAVEEQPAKAAEAPVAVEQTQPEAPAMPESNTIICRNCGNRLPERAIFCGNCGTPVVTASAEEKAVEEKAVEEKAAVAAETSVQIEGQAAKAVETPVTVEEHAAKAVEAPAAAEQQPANAAVIANPAMPAGNMAMPVNGAEPAPKKKKKIRKAPIIAAAAAVFVAAGAAVGYFCFHDKITRLIMGDAGYAKKIEADSYTDYMLPEAGADNDGVKKAAIQYANTVLSTSRTALQSYSESNTENGGDNLTDTDRQLISAMELFNSSVYSATGGKDAGYSVEYDFDISLGTQLKGLMGSEADKILNIINSLGCRYTAVAGDTSKIGLDLLDEQGDLGGIELYMNGSDLCIAAPEITDSVIAFKLPEREEKDSAPSAKEEDIKRIIEGIGNIYFSYFDKAEITYTDNAVTAAGKTGTKVSIKLDGSVIKEMAAEMLDFIRDDSFVKAYLLSAGITEEKYNEAFDKAAADLAAKEIEGYAEIINYVDVHNNVLGKTIVMYDDSTKSKAEIAISSAENRTLIDFSEEKEGKSEGRFSIINEKSGETSGTLYFKMPIENEKSGEKLLSIAVDYESTGETTFLGNKVPLCKITIRFAEDDTLIDSIGSAQSSQTESQQGETSAKLMESIGPSGSSLAEMLLSGQFKKSQIEMSIENGEKGPVGKVSFKLGELLSVSSVMSFTEIHEQAVMPSLDKAIDIEKGSKKEQTLLQLDFMKWAKKLSERNDLLNELLPLDNIDESIEQAEESLKFYDHYSQYTDYLAYSADRDAEKLDEAFNNGISNEKISFNDAPTDVELYFDSEGNVVVIESGSWYGDFPAVFSDCELKSAYVRIGVTTYETHTIVVYTDKSTDLPAKLPDRFNFIDGVYDWDESNVIGEFIVGTYPALVKGESTAADKFAAMDKSVAQLEKYAEAIGKTAQNAERTAGTAIVSTESAKASEISLEVAADGNGSWSIVKARENRWEEMPEDYFDLKFLDSFISLLGSSSETRGIRDCSAEIIFVNGELVGVNAYNTGDELSFEDYGLPAGDDFVSGYYFMWAGKESVWEEAQHGYYLSGNGIPVALGTYCIKTGKPLGTYNDYFAEGAGFDFSAAEGTWEWYSVNGADIAQQPEYADLKITLIVSANSVIMTNGEETHEAVPMPTDSSTFVCEFDDNYGGTISFTFRYIEDRDIIICYPDDDDISSIEFKRGQLPLGYSNSDRFDFGVVEGGWRISAVGNMDTGDVIDIGPNDGVDITLSISANNVVLANGEESYSGAPVMAAEGSVFTCVFKDEYGTAESIIFSYAADEDKIYCYSDLEDESGYFIFSRAQ